MRRFGGTHRMYKTPARGLFSRSSKKTTRLPKRHVARQRVIRHSAEPLVLRQRAGLYSRKSAVSTYNYWKFIKQLLLPVLFASWFGLLIYLPYFRVTKVVFYGLQIIKKDEINSYLNQTVLNDNLPLLPGNNYFLLSPKKITDEIQKKFSVSSITVTKVFPNEVHIELQEKVSSLIYANDRQYFLLDQNGTIIKFLGEDTPTGFSTSTENDPLISHDSLGTPAIDTATTTPTAGLTATVPTPSQTTNYFKVRNLFGNLPLLIDSSYVSSTDNQTTIVPEATLKGAIDFEDMLEKRGVTTVKYFELQGAGAGLAVHTSQPWIIYFKPTDDLESQFANLKLVLEQNHPSEYVDLRYGERVYWK